MDPTNTPPRVLLADDDEEICDLVAASLRGVGFDVTAVTDGGRLLVQIARTYRTERSSESFDLFVSDVRMPICDGIQILEQLRSAHWPIAAILMTAFNDPTIRAHAHALGAVLFIKPFDLADLERAALELASSGASRASRFG